MQDPRDFAVLVVEDDPLLRFDMVDLVEDAGFVAHEARNADEAIEEMNRNPAIRVVLTDIEMPGSMDGLKLAFLVRKRWPPVVILVISGKRNVSQTDLPEDVLLLSKPYSPAMVVRTLRKAAAANPPG
ncbi:response regulator [uncultured Jannaschia sp.]|uniref:response regulator n=1 Tax=uncultured Jannaschia sp. TaxID=293347 RepID=UPI002621CC0C|nr:response regulator [uncultured Jannaschia sp.]